VEQNQETSFPNYKLVTFSLEQKDHPNGYTPTEHEG